MIHFITYFVGIAVYLLIGYFLPLKFAKTRHYIKAQLELKNYERDYGMQLGHIMFLSFGVVGVGSGIFNIALLIILFILGAVIRLSTLLYASYAEDLLSWYKRLL